MRILSAEELAWMSAGQYTPHGKRWIKSLKFPSLKLFGINYVLTKRKFAMTKE